MSESTGFNIDNKILKIKENFKYTKDFNITATITGMKNIDDFGNFPFTVVIKLNGQTVTSIMLKNVIIFPSDPNANQKSNNNNNNNTGGPSLSVAFKQFEGTAVELIADIQAAVSKATLEEISKGNEHLTPYYSELDFTSPKWIEDSRKYKVKHKKDKKEYNKGFQLQVYFDKQTEVLNMPIKEYPNPHNLREITHLTGPKPLTKSTLDYYGSSDALIKKAQRYNIFNNVYGKSYQDLSRLPESRLNLYNELITKSTFVSTLGSKTAITLLFGFGDIKSNLNRNYSGWKFILNALYVTPRVSAAEEAADACEDELRSMMDECVAPPPKQLEIKDNEQDIEDIED